MNTLMTTKNNFYSPLKSLNHVAKEMDRFFDSIDLFSPREISYFEPQDWVLKESDKDYTVSLALPGVDKNNVNISSLKGKLTISYENKENTETDFKYSKFSKSWKLPNNVLEEQISASYVDGILKVLIPKTAEPEAKMIEIKG